MRNVNSVLCSLWLLRCCYHNMSHNQCVTTFERQTVSLNWGEVWRGCRVGALSACVHMFCQCIVSVLALQYLPWFHFKYTKKSEANLVKAVIYLS